MSKGRPANRFKVWLFPVLVFLTGGCVLVVELTAIRLLSPYYGNTIYNFTSVISVILAGLSGGYYYGGKLADRRPQAEIFYGIITASGLALLAMYYAMSEALPSISSSLGVASGPLVSSLLFFLLPALMLGTLSPYAVKLHAAATPDKGVGEVSGQIFFASTLGSIMGSIGTGFVFIPYYGVSTIMIVTSGLLVVLGIVPMLATRLISIKMTVVVTLAASVFALGGALSSGVRADTIVHAEDGVYERIEVSEGIANGRPARFMIQDRSNSGAAYIDESSPTDVVFEYAKYYVVAEVFADKLDRALVIGGGAYTVPRAVTHIDSDVVVDVVEIEPVLEELSREYFNLGEEPRIKTVIDDGRRVLAATESNYDYIFSDAYSSLYSIPSHLVTAEFFQLAHDKLTPGGVFMANVIGSLKDYERSITLSQYKTFASVFDTSYVIASESTSIDDPQNLIFIGTRDSRELDFADIADNSNNDFTDTFAGKLVDMSDYDLHRQIKLTDNYSPTDLLTTGLLDI